PNGATAAVGGAGGQGLIRLWDLHKDKEIVRLPVQQHVITSLAFSPDGRLLVSGGSDQTVRLWEVLTGREIFAFQKHQGPVTAVAFSANGRLVASGSGTKSPPVLSQERQRVLSQERQHIRLWNVVTGEEVPHQDESSS